MPQGLPNLVQAVFVKNDDMGLMHALLSPEVVITDIAGAKRTVECRTNYSFDNEIQYNFQTDRGFDFQIRVPTCAVDSSLASSLGSTSTFDSTTGVQKITIPAGQSSTSSEIGTGTRTEPRANNATRSLSRAAPIRSQDRCRCKIRASQELLQPHDLRSGICSS